MRAAVSAPGSRSELLRAVPLALLRLYRTLVSPLLPRACRFEPSCSAYAEEALLKRPILQALGLIVRRLLRCHPFHQGGYDPVP